LSRPARLELPEVPPLKSPTSSPRGRAWLRPLGLVAATAALVAGTALVTQWADRPTDRTAPDRGGSRVDPDSEPVKGTGSGRVMMAKDSREGVRMTVEARGLLKIGEGQFYEVVQLEDPEAAGARDAWTRRQCLARGARLTDWPLPGRRHRPGARDDRDPGHSVTSVLRAKYT
jgi:hypothetical protein